ASFCRDRRRFPEALKLLEEAEAAAPPEDIPRILVKRAVTLEHMGDSEGAIEVLRKAVPLADLRREPRKQLNVYFNLAANYCHLERYDEAAHLLPRVHELADGVGRKLILIREVWLRGRIGAGQGRVAEARAAFDQVRREFET